MGWVKNPIPTFHLLNKKEGEKNMDVIKLKKKLQKDDNAVSGSVIILILVIGSLLFLQYGMAFLGYPTLTDYIEGLQKPESFYCDYDIKDVVTHYTKTYEIWFFGSANTNDEPKFDNVNVNKYTIESGDNPVAMVYNTNVPVSFSQPYYSRLYYTPIEYDYYSSNSSQNRIIYDGSIQLVYEKAYTGINDFGDNEYSVELEPFLRSDTLLNVGVQSNYFEFYVYNPSGSVIFYDHFIITKQSNNWW